MIDIQLRSNSSIHIISHNNLFDMLELLDMDLISIKIPFFVQELALHFDKKKSGHDLKI